MTIIKGGTDNLQELRHVYNKVIIAIAIAGDVLCISFEDGSRLEIVDGGQSCCEDRYMRTDDDLNYYKGSELYNVEVRDAGETAEFNTEVLAKVNKALHAIEKETKGRRHEIQFLLITTSKGVFTISNHNEHNGYYGGFSLEFEIHNLPPHQTVLIK